MPPTWLPLAAILAIIAVSALRAWSVERAHGVKAFSFGRHAAVQSVAERNWKLAVLLALTFANPADYEKIQEDDTIDILGLGDFAAGKPLTIRLTHKEGKPESFDVNHTFNDNQIAWYRAGGALNLIRLQQAN